MKKSKQQGGAGFSSIGKFSIPKDGFKITGSDGKIKISPDCHNPACHDPNRGGACGKCSEYENSLKPTITLDSLLKDNCKLAKELWGEYDYVHYGCNQRVDKSVTKKGRHVCQYMLASFVLSYKYHLRAILNNVIEGGSIQEYINKTQSES